MLVYVCIHMNAIPKRVLYARQLDLQLRMLSVPIATNVVRSNPAHGEVCSIQHYVKKFVSDLRHVGGFLWELRFPPLIKLTATIRIFHLFIYSILKH
jgi:hypothetical protein